MRAQDMVDNFPIVDIDSPAREAVQLLAEHRLSGLVVTDHTRAQALAVLPASQVVRFLVPGYVQDDPGLAGVLTESMADHAADRLRDKTIRDLLPHKRERVPIVDADDTIIEVAEIMSRMHSPLVTVLQDGRLRGVITAERLLAEALKQRVGP